MKIILVDAKHCFIIEKEGKFEIFHDMYKMLETYHNRKIILTNAIGEKFKILKLDKSPYEVFNLGNNPSKNSSQYYKLLLDEFGFKSNDVIYFEHNINAVESAQSVGINTYYYDNDKKDLESLKIFLDTNLISNC